MVVRSLVTTNIRPKSNLFPLLLQCNFRVFDRMPHISPLCRRQQPLAPTALLGPLPLAEPAAAALDCPFFVPCGGILAPACNARRGLAHRVDLSARLHHGIMTSWHHGIIRRGRERAGGRGGQQGMYVGDYLVRLT